MIERKVNNFIFNLALQHQSTGQYRDMTSLVWDPFPQYIITAFGIHLHLLLYQDNHFLSQNLKVSWLFSKC